MKLSWLTFTILIVVNLPVYGQSKKELKEQKKAAEYQQVLNLVAAKNFEFVGKFAYPQKGRQIDLTTRPNFLRIIGLQAKADMPYFGRAFSGGYTNDGGGIVFDSEVMDYQVEENNKKNRLTVRFRVKGANDTYKCILEVGSLESATFLVTSSNRQSIRYNGILKEIEEGQPAK